MAQRLPWDPDYQSGDDVGPAARVPVPVNPWRPPLWVDIDPDHLPDFTAPIRNMLMLIQLAKAAALVVLAVAIVRND